MPLRSSRIDCAFAAAALGVALTVSPALAAWPHDPQVNVPVSVASGLKQNQVAIPDGAGGMIIAWSDYRNGTGRIYAQRLTADGNIAFGWPLNGLEVRPGFPTRRQDFPSICTDGGNGAIIAWQETFTVTDRDIIAQHVTATGALAWGTFGSGIATSGLDQDVPKIIASGTGGAFLIWSEDHSVDFVPTGYDVYAQRIDSAGNDLWGGITGVILCNATGNQINAVLAADGFGGLVAAWKDPRGPESGAIYTTRRDSSSALRPGWTANGFKAAAGNYGFSAPLVAANSSGGPILVWNDDRNGNGTSDLFVESFLGTGNSLNSGGDPVCTAAGAQYNPHLTPDGAGGVFVTWDDGRGASVDVYSQRVGPSGNLVAGWPAATVGLPIATGSDDQFDSVVASDGAGGCLIGYERIHTGAFDLYATHVTASGAVAEGWDLTNPAAICEALATQQNPLIVSDGAAGAILAWNDGRNGNTADLYAQRVEKWGKLGNPEPSIASVRDIPGDQGGHVRVSWNSSYLDAYPTFGVSAYWLWRQVPVSAALAALRNGGARLLEAGEDPGAVRGSRLRAQTTGAQTTYWEYVTSQVANGFPAYSLVAPTAADSAPGSNLRTLFMVEARATGHIAWGSAPDSGYSVDNVAPPAPIPFAATYTAGTTHLHWSPPVAPDLAGYRLYRGTGAGFVPGPGNLIGAPGDTMFADSPGGFYYYKVSAVDTHGNESPTTLAFPSGTTDVTAVAASALELLGMAPNPVRDGAACRWSQPRSEAVRITLVDLAGRRVRTLVSGVQSAGPHSLSWDARDDAGRTVASGIYFLTLEAESRSIRTRVAVVR